MSELTKLEEAQNKIREAQQKIDTILSQSKEIAKSAFKEGIDALFEQFPILAGFSWTQYTPYFNDGDTCYFSVQSDYPNIWYTDTENKEDSAYDYDNQFSTYNTDKNNPKDAAGIAVIEFLQYFDSNIMLSMFDDHVKIIVTRDGVKVEEYSHD